MRSISEPLAESTLAELRAFVAAAEGFPGESVVRARCRFGANSDGSLVKRLYVAEPDPRDRA